MWRLSKQDHSRLTIALVFVAAVAVLLVLGGLVRWRRSRACWASGLLLGVAVLIVYLLKFDLTTEVISIIVASLMVAGLWVAGVVFTIAMGSLNTRRPGLRRGAFTQPALEAWTSPSPVRPLEGLAEGGNGTWGQSYG